MMPISSPAPVRQSIEPRVYIFGLALQFRCLQNKIRHLRPSDEFATTLEKISRPWSHGERVAALFICAVWSGHNWKGKGKAFDLVDACSVLCAEDRTVIIEWVMNPYWP
jgi:hypothetical protein